MQQCFCVALLSWLLPCLLIRTSVHLPQARVANPAVIIVGTHWDKLSSQDDHSFLAMQLQELASKYRIPRYHPEVIQNWKGPPAEGVCCDSVRVHVWCDRSKSRRRIICRYVCLQGTTLVTSAGGVACPAPCRVPPRVGQCGGELYHWQGHSHA